MGYALSGITTQIFFTVEVVVGGPEPEPCKTHYGRYFSHHSPQPEFAAFDLPLSRHRPPSSPSNNKLSLSELTDSVPV